MNHAWLYSRLKFIFHKCLGWQERRELQRRHPSIVIARYNESELKRLRTLGFRAQLGQDYFLVSQRLVPESGGRFIDIGCNHPESGSNSYYFEEKAGYTGVAIDALNSYQSQWAQLRPRTRFFSEFISSQTSLIEFSEINGVQGWESMLSGASDSVSIEGKSVTELKRKVRPRRLDDLLKENHLGFGVDVLFLDVEGHEKEVLDSADWTGPKPKVLVIENTGSPTARESLRSHLNQLGYSFFARIGILDDVYRVSGQPEPCTLNGTATGKIRYNNIS